MCVCDFYIKEEKSIPNGNFEWFAFYGAREECKMIKDICFYFASNLDKKAISFRLFVGLLLVVLVYQSYRKTFFLLFDTSLFCSVSMFMWVMWCNEIKIIKKLVLFFFLCFCLSNTHETLFISNS